ncbi:MORN repeat-containing protein 4-like [Lineus longissimus]|uniref:MORN repeat-containing protein 4-like n=1 Tax=Lineus longissimus TaxID=88925 RepID=UPI002B4EF9CF
MTTTGTYKYPDGSEYAGEWSEVGMRHGLGHMTFLDGSMYTGRFDAGLCSGLGVMVFADGSRYEGEFMMGKYNGVGVFTRCDGMKFEGEFKNGKIFGSGLLTFADGTNGLPRNEGTFDGNKLTKREKCQPIIQKALLTAERARSQHL